eukprot:TRINITY_DN67091_c5_g2_i1.p1 TRINITY_DN67091_c5_g2~~TRINITY_DN67091_c5_g2_i1.p1  ORF type:complete len:305 (+),score=61.57 TRINITY_DN67091_c5_g2_i1:280-1194(+)
MTEIPKTTEAKDNGGQGNRLWAVAKQMVQQQQVLQSREERAERIIAREQQLWLKERQMHHREQNLAALLMTEREMERSRLQAGSMYSNRMAAGGAVSLPSVGGTSGRTNPARKARAKGRGGKNVGRRPTTQSSTAGARSRSALHPERPSLMSLLYNSANGQPQQQQQQQHYMDLQRRSQTPTIPPTYTKEQLVNMHMQVAHGGGAQTPPPMMFLTKPEVQQGPHVYQQQQQQPQRAHTRSGGERSVPNMDARRPMTGGTAQQAWKGGGSPVPTIALPPSSSPTSLQPYVGGGSAGLPPLAGFGK